MIHVRYVNWTTRRAVVPAEMAWVSSAPLKKRNKRWKNRLLYYSVYTSVTVSQACNKPDPLRWAVCARARAFSLMATETNFASFCFCRAWRALRVGQDLWEEDAAQHWWPCEAFTHSGKPTASSCSSAVICCSSVNLFPPAAAFLDVEHSRRLPSHPKCILRCADSQSRAKAPTGVCHEACECEGYSSLYSQVAGGKKQL